MRLATIGTKLGFVILLTMGRSESHDPPGPE
jgi:hypothetical protein